MLVPRTPATSFDPNAGRPIDMTPVVAPSAPVKIEDVIGAAFRQENVIGSLMAQQTAGGERVSGYNPWDEIKGTEYEEYWDRFIASGNPGQTAAMKRQLDMETEDRNTLNASGGWGLLATLGASVFSPENLLPGGAYYRGARAGQAIIKTALSTAAATALGTSLAETGLMASQELRTPVESAFNVGGSALLGGMLGAGASALFSKADFARVANGMADEALAATDFKTLADNEAAVFSSMSPSSAGAAARPVESIDENTIAGRAAQIAGGAVANLNPVLRALHSPSAAMRDVATRLFENPLYMKKNMEGVASAPGVETLVKEYTQGAMARAVGQANDIFSGYRKAGGQLDRNGFNEAIGKAMRRGDAGDDPAISQAAASWRAAVFDPLKDRAIAAGLLPKDVSTDTALSYFTRVYNRPMIEAREVEFKGIVRRYIGQQIRDMELKQDEIRLGNTIVKADAIGERFRGANERLERMETRMAGRSSIRGRKLAELNELDRRKFLAQQGRPPVELVRLLRGKDANANMLTTLREARKAERSAGRKKSYAERFPILSRLKSSGVLVGSPLDFELRSMGVTPQSHPGLFRKEGGSYRLDNWVYGEDDLIAEALPAPADGTVYVDERALMEAVRAEVAGNPIRSIEDQMREAAQEGDISWAEQWLEQLGLSADTNVGQARDFIRRVNGAEREADDLVARSVRLQKELEEFDDASELIANEKAISEAEMQAVAKEMNDLNEEILAMQQLANASPRVSIIVDYAKVRRDLFKKKLDQRNLTSRVDALKSLRDNGRANPAMLDELYAKTEDLTRVNSDVQRLTAKADKLQPMMPKMTQEIPAFLDDADRASYVDEIVNNIFNTITGRNADGDVPRDIVAATRGPLKERTFHIPDEQIEAFLESNVEAVARRYARTMASDIELTNAFGKADLKEQIDQIKASYQELRAAVAADVDPATGAPLEKKLTAAQKEKRVKELVSREKADIRDLQALRDMIRGSYLAKENSSNFARVARVAGTVNYLRTMGGVTLSSAADIARHVMVHGMGNVMRDGLVPLIKNLKGFKMSVEEAKIAGAVTERLLNTRMATWADLSDPYSMGSPFERFMENTANGFSRLNGLVYWNDFQKSFASVLTQNRILRGAGDYAKLDKREKAYLAYLGIDGSMAQRIAKQFDAHGTIEDGGVRVAGTDEWDDDWARRVYRAAINKDVDTTIISKGVGDIPLFMNTPAGRLIMQFKSFAIASHQRALMRGLQERPMGFLAGTMAATGIGMLIYYLKSLEANRLEDVSDNPGRWIAEGLDRSGLFSVAFEVNNTVEKAFGIGAYGALAAAFPGFDQDGKASRYTMRSQAAALTGPTGDLIDTAIRAAQAIKGAGDGFTQGDINSIRRLVPGATLPGIRSLVEYTGMPAIEQAMGLN